MTTLCSLCFYEASLPTVELYVWLPFGLWNFLQILNISRCLVAVTATVTPRLFGLRHMPRGSESHMEHATGL